MFLVLFSMWSGKKYQLLVGTHEAKWEIMSELKNYGWGFLDKNGPTNQFMSAGNESLLEYKLALLHRERPNDAPFQVVQLFYKTVSD